MAGPRKTISIHDYPEHLNPFREDDNHNKIRFWTIGRRLSRSNSISFSGIKDLKNSWSLRSFMRKGKKGDQSSKTKTNDQVNGDNSPIMFRRALQYSSTSGARSTVGSPERADRYVYGGSVTPLPRSRFQERLRSSQQEVNSLSATPRMARSDIMGSRLSMESTNPFDEAPIPPVRASRRKKKRAPPPPSSLAADESITSENSELRITETDDSKVSSITIDDDIDNMNIKVDLKIVEDEENVNIHNEPNPETIQLDKSEVNDERLKDAVKENTKDVENNNNNKESDDDAVEVRSESTRDIASGEPFPKIDIIKYRRNSSVNEDDIRLRRGNLEDFHPLSNKRSKSLTNTFDSSYVTYDINLNANNIDINSNEEPQKVVCKVYNDVRKASVDNSISSTERDFQEIDRATRELEREINKLNTALIEDDLGFDNSRLSVSEIRQKFDRNGSNSPNPIPKPRRSHYGETSTNTNGNIVT